MSAPPKACCWLAVSVLALACATSEEDPDRKPPGGFADAAGGTGGTGGQPDSSADAKPLIDSPADVSVDTSAEAGTDAGADAADAPTQDGSSGSHIVIVSRSSTGLALATRSASSSTFSTQTLPSSVSDTPAVTGIASGALIVVRGATQGELRYSTWTAATGKLSALTAVGVAGTTVATPALTSATDATLAFLGTDFKFYVSRYNGAWQGFVPVIASAVHSFGPSAPTVASLPSAEAVAFAGDDANLYTQIAQGGSFQAAFGHPTSASLDKGISPAIVARTSGSPPFVVVYVEASTKQLLWTQGNAANWSTPAPVSTAANIVGSPALAALAGGDVLLAFRASDDRLRTTVLSGGKWSLLASPFPSSVVSAPPAVARGLASLGELAWVSSGTLLASSLSASGWDPPTTVIASAQAAVAMATVGQ